MKTMLIAAATTGAVIAGLILMLKKQDDRKAGSRTISTAAKDAYHKMNGAIGGAERSVLHTMG